GDPGDHSARTATAEAANGAVWLSGPGGHASRAAFAATHAGGGDRADPRAVSGAVLGLQHSPLLADGPAGEGGERFLHAGQADPAGSRARQEGSGARAT